MADPFSLSISLQNARLALDALKFYQRMSGDFTASSFITSLQASIVSNNVPVTPIAGYASVMAQSAVGVAGSAD